MQNDEQAIRDLVAAWMTASTAGDVNTLRDLMADDVVFLTPSNAPMRGRAPFLATFQTMMQHVKVEAKSDIQEIQVSGDIAYCWNHLVVTVTPKPSGSPILRTGHALSILRKQADGRWVISRDANLLTTQASA